MATGCALWASCSTSSLRASTRATAMRCCLLQPGDLVLQQIEDYTKRIAMALKTVGLINIQFAVKDDTVYIIEANPVRRAPCPS